jgi:small-conductance mechanosensitive channel
MMASWMIAAIFFCVVASAGLVVHYLAFRISRSLSPEDPKGLRVALRRYLRKPALALWLIIASFAALPVLPMAPAFFHAVSRFISISALATTIWLAFALARVIESVVAAKEQADHWDDHAVRQVRTRIRLLRRIAFVLIVFLAVGAGLTMIPSVRHLGVSVLASAGILGLAGGIAAKPILSNLIAGVQVALTQPIRFGDVVVVENEWGTIEEIYMTYVVVRIWDSRRLIIPLSYFMDRPFQNWTRRTDDLLAKAFVYTDYTAPVSEVREELHRVLKESPLWNGDVWKLEVTNVSERAIELRALMSASNSTNAWDLQCYVREALVKFLQARAPKSLPQTREVELQP